MNAVATPPVKPDITTPATPAAVHRHSSNRGDASQGTPSFMRAMHAVNRDKPTVHAPEDHTDAPQTIAKEDQSGPSIAGEGLPDMAALDAHGVVAVESPAIVLPGDGMGAMAEPAIPRRIATGAAEEPAAPSVPASEDESSLKATKFVGDLPGAVSAHHKSGMPAAAPQTQGQTAGPTILQAPAAPNTSQDPGTGANAPPFTRTTGTPAEESAPGTADIFGDSGARIPTSDKRPPHAINAHAIAVARQNSLPSRPGQPNPMPEGGEALHRQPQAVDSQTTNPASRLFDEAGRQANLTTSAPAPNPEMGMRRESGKAALPTAEGTPSARSAVESAATQDDASLNGDGKRSQAHPRPWLAADQNPDAKSTERPLRFDLNARSDGMTAVDRPGTPPVGKTPPPLLVERAPTPTAEAFRSQNLEPIVERIAVSVRGRQSEARIALKPDHLGSIRLQIATENNTVNIRIMTEFPMARDLLESHLPQLKTDLQQQGLELDEFNITLDDEEQHFRREERRQPGTLRAPLGDGRRKALSEEASEELTENHPADRRPTATGVDFFA